MVKRSLSTLLAAAAIMATAGLSCAATSASSSTASLDSTPVDTNPLLMYSLDKVPAGKNSLGQDISNAGFDIYGYIEVGYTANLSGQHHPIPGRVFDTEGGNNIQMDQLDLAVSRSINLTDSNFRKAGWGIGGKVEFLYGYDAGLIHSNGLNFYHSWANNAQVGNNGAPYPKYQFDPEQLYVSFGIPIGKESGLKVRVGKFDTLLGEETINPTTNYFYSHTYEFGYAIPFTNTGIMADYMLNSQWSFWGGVVQPWNQSTRSNINGVNVMGEVDYTPASNMSLIVNYIFGPNDQATTGSTLVYGDNQHDRSVLDIIGTYTPPILNNNLTLIADLDWGYDAGGAGLGAIAPGVVGGTSSDANWYAGAFYQSYVINSYLTFNTREEIYYDDGNDTVALGLNPLSGGGSTLIGDLTAGVTITPMPNSNLGKHLEFRPELREDLCDHPYFNGKHYQTTLGMDAIYQF